VRVRFDDFVFDEGARQLLRAGSEVRLGPKAFELLEVLLRERPRALAKSRLQARIWPQTAVVEANLTNLVAELREALGDEPRKPRYLRTVYAFGYAFCGRAIEEPDEAAAVDGSAFRLLLERREIPLRQGENVIGRSHDAVAQIDSPSVSRRHARILVAEGKALLEDLGSKNGTWLHEKLIEGPVPLSDRDAIRVGTVQLVFLSSPRPGSTMTQ
jgi:DNA-binding winged helix-turn-helix (wHTH) protein